MTIYFIKTLCYEVKALEISLRSLPEVEEGGLEEVALGRGLLGGSDWARGAWRDVREGERTFGG